MIVIAALAIAFAGLCSMLSTGIADRHPYGPF